MYEVVVRQVAVDEFRVELPVMRSGAAHATRHEHAAIVDQADQRRHLISAAASKIAATLKAARASGSRQAAGCQRT